MTAPRSARSLSRKGWERLLDQDPFTRVRTDAELAALVLQAGRHTPTPYAVLVTALLGRPGLREAPARELWGRVVDHRRALAAAMGRPVHLRVAALDLLLAEKSAPAPIVLDRGLVRSLVVDATTDTLTGLPNRRHLLTVLEHELRQRRRPAVAVLDVDGFKRVNDTHGHARGDDVLRGLARILDAGRRQGDVAARLGGDEFALVLVDASQAAAAAVLDRIDAAFGRDFGALGVGLSAGLVAGEALGSAAEVLEEADRRMYVAKRSRSAAGRVEVPPIVGLYASGLEDRFHAFHGMLARWGVLLFPARTADVARRLVPLLAPRLLLVDLMLPPRGGANLLEELGRASRGARRLLVAPERWRGVRRGAPGGIEVVAYPPSAHDLAQAVRDLGPDAPIARPPLASEADASRLLAVVERLARGEATPDLAELARWRPEVDHLRKLLGA